MQAFAMIALLGLAVLVVSGIAGRYLVIAREFLAVAMVVLGLAGVWILDFDVFAASGLTARNHTVGLVFTGLVVAGAGYFWQPVMAFFAGLARKYSDEAQVLEKDQNLHRVA
ncbi:hypothetical protein [Amycolatopsis sp. NPDC059657]|uniref:hypothetical protein n=1 Tax=Amycolatopsis sp. NPDC059657 TaxID=3346899 RepID=UPI0036706870